MANSFPDVKYHVLNVPPLGVALKGFSVHSVLPSKWKESLKKSCRKDIFILQFYVPRGDEEPHLIQGSELNYLDRDLNLSKQNFWDQNGCSGTCWLRKEETRDKNRQEQYSFYYINQDSLCVCSDVNGLMEEMAFLHYTVELRLFIDASKLSLHAVLSQDGNINPSVPVACAVAKRESYESMSLLLSAVNYKKHCWQICGDLKMNGFLLGQQTGYTNIVFFFELVGLSSNVETLYYEG
jgi:hypothetical protein